MIQLEKGQIYLAIGLFILGWSYDVEVFKALSAGIFLGCGTYFFTNSLFEKDRDL